MAHADYDCCAICDRKLSYAGGNSSTKIEICTDCLRNLHNAGIKIFDVKELKKWLEEENDIQKIRNILKNIGFEFCYYNNSTDDLVRKKLRLKKDETL